MVVPLADIESIVIQSRESSDGWPSYCLAVVTANQTLSLEKTGGCFPTQEKAEERALIVRSFLGLHATRERLLNESIAKAQSDADNATLLAPRPRRRYFA
jgi:hypothetical protein